MRILVSNDDGILAEGLWALVKELKSIARIVVVAPDREQSATGTAVTLRQPLIVQKVPPPFPEVETYSVDGTPSDSVILALGKLVKDKVDLVVSGINYGTNLGDDALISGTVGAAMQGYLRGLPAIAISVARGDILYLDDAARIAVLLAKRIISNVLPANIFLNVNLPNLPLTKIKGVKITRLDSKSHINTVQEGNDGKQKYYRLVRQEIVKNRDESTDTGAIARGYISITPLHTNLFDEPSPPIPAELCSELFEGLSSWTAPS